MSLLFFSRLHKVKQLDLLLDNTI